MRRAVSFQLQRTCYAALQQQCDVAERVLCHWDFIYLLIIFIFILFILEAFFKLRF